MITLITKARVQITVEIEASGFWGSDCTMGQIIHQASQSALGQLRHSLSGYKIVGDPTVTAFTTIGEKNAQ